MEHSAFASSFAPARITASPFAPAATPLRARRARSRVFACAPPPPPPPPKKQRGLLRRLATAVLAAALLAAPLVPPPALLPHAAEPAQAARGGGRVGGSSFRSAPRSSGGFRGGYGGGGGGYGYRGGGYYGGGGVAAPVLVNPFLMPMYGFGYGGGGLVTLMFAGAAVAALARVGGAVFARSADGEEFGGGGPPPGAVVSLKLGLLASARGVQDELDRIARGADTATARGLAAVLQEAVVSLLRHPDYWTHAAAAGARERSPEAAFNTAAADERAKLRRETLSNVRGAVRERTREDPSADAGPQEFIVVTLLVAADPALAQRFPTRVSSTADVRRALQALATVRADDLQALELLWAPQDRADVLTRQEMLEDHPELRAL